MARIHHSHDGSRGNRLGCLAMVAILGIATTPFGANPVRAQRDPQSPKSYSDRDVMAAYFFRLGNFYEWPGSLEPDSGEPIQACVIGPDPFRHSLDYFEGRKVRGHPFNLRHISHLDEIDGCHLLYVGITDRAQARSILLHVHRRGVLTVGLGIEFAELGGCVGFVLEDRRVRLAVNPSETRRAGLQISSKLLEVSVVVGEEGE